MARVSKCSTPCRDSKGMTATTTTATTVLPLPLSPSASMAGLRAYGAETSTMAIRLSFSPLTPSKRRALEGGAPEHGRTQPLDTLNHGPELMVESPWAKTYFHHARMRWYVAN
uniref:Uncharacterized protein n=1 Tax=Oryza barthii TaxID=65489 RepID=A0A0D3H044_9ORYZ